jgi:glycerate-2-kinase
VVGSVDTDGSDGPGGGFDPEATAAGCLCLSGGVVDGYTVEEAAAQGVDVSAALRTHATSAALWKLKSGVWATQNTASTTSFYCLSWTMTAEVCGGGDYEIRAAAERLAGF